MEQPGRLAEILGALSFATDLAAGLGYESAIKTCVVASMTAEAAGVEGEELADVYYAALCRFLGCSAYAYEAAATFGAGDDMGALRALAPADVASPASVLGAAIRGIGRDAPLTRRVRALVSLATDRSGPFNLASAHCTLATFLAAELGLRPAVTEALGQIYERFDGKGLPLHLKGEQQSRVARLVQLAFRVVAQATTLGPEPAVEAVRERSGKELDPELASAFLRIAPGVIAGISRESAWETFLSLEPAPHAVLAPAELPRVAQAFGWYADMKSPYQLGHSTGVAALAASAGTTLGMAAPEVAELEIAGLLHDLGRISVPNGIWDKAGVLNANEFERVRQHPYHTERILGQSTVLAPYARLAGLHHERSDGSGYHRGLPASALSPAANVLAAADAFRLKLEDRPYRRALTAEAAAAYLRAQAEVGKLEPRAVDAVLTAAGLRAERLRGELPSGLSEREAEVLGLAARGLTNKEIGTRLVISPRTVQNHLLSAYAKTGTNNRAGAAVFALKHGLIE